MDRDMISAERIEDLSVTYSEDGIETIRELDKVILSKGSWTTILFRYQEWNRSKEQYGPEKYTIRRYQKRNGEYRQQSKFNISSRAQALALIQGLQTWLDEAPDQSTSA
jgi:hypothetical protein